MSIYNPLIKTLALSETKRYAGLSGCNDFSPTLLAQASQEALLIARAKGVWRLYDYNPQAGCICSSPPLMITGEKVLQHLAKCKKIVFMAVTIGEDIDIAINQHFAAGNYTSSVLLDAAATALVEAAADKTEEYIKQLASSKGYNTLFRFSPGYSAWELTVQPYLLELLQASRIGLTATPTCMLLPRKSITALLGWLPATDDTLDACRPSCNECTQENCPARKPCTISSALL